MPFKTHEGRRRIPPQHRQELAEDRKVTTPWTITEEKILLGEVGLEQIERSLVGRLDHRGIVVGRADQPSPRDLSSGEHLVRLRCILIGELKTSVKRQDATRLLRIDVVGPPPVIHHLRDPLVAEVLQQEVEKRRRRVGRHHATTSERLLEHRDFRRRVHHQIAVLAVIVAPRQDRDERHRRIG